MPRSINISLLQKLKKNKVNLIQFNQDGKVLCRIEDKKGSILAFA